ncbi:thioesterase family protein [Myxococcus fulvus]|uniref:thioesterase family protein n=1 Tax=Myxococcus fulvus TaxID=33 RepID=UPI003B9A316C
MSPLLSPAGHVAYFVRTGDGGFLPQRACAGAWNPEELHISPVNGLLLHELERWLANRKHGGKFVTRISYDYLGVLDFTRCEVAFELLRPGRAVELVEGILSQHGRPVLRARVWLLATQDTSAVAGGAREPLSPPEDGRPFALTRVWPGDYVASVDMRVLEGPVPGSTTAWLTTPLAIVEGDTVSDLARFALLVDTSNGIAVRRRPEEWQFPNVDLTIHLFRQPVGHWIGFDTRVVFGPTGHGLTSSDLFDQHGHVGHAEQILLVRPR